MSTTSTSKYKGVTWSSKMQGWMVQIYHNGKKFHLGTFKGKDAERRAAIHYDKKAILLGMPTNILKPLKKSAA